MAHRAPRAMSWARAVPARPGRRAKKSIRTEVSTTTVAPELVKVTLPHAPTEGLEQVLAALLLEQPPERQVDERGLRPDSESPHALLLKYKALVRYDAFLAEGMPISTGVIEGACRHLVRDRMDITGARWRLPRAEAVLKIRSLRSSGDFEDYWAFHEHQEFIRNHASRYRDGRPPDLVRASPRAHLRLVT